MNLQLRDKIVEALKMIPGISKKQAGKIVTYFLEVNPEYTSTLFLDIIDLQKQTKKCTQCLAYTTKDICDICLDKKRGKKLFVVQDNNDIEKIEQLDIEKGKYFVFNEYINTKQISNEITKKINHLLSVASKNDEIILALNTDINGQITMKFLEKKIRDELKNKDLYQLSVGIPFGMSIDAADPISLKQAILNKKKV
ncbi:toprim domain-containing protein [Mycoplasma sp. 3398]